MSFYWNQELSSISLGNSVEEIAAYVFYGETIDELVVPDSVKLIGAKTFEETSNLRSLNLRSSIELIELEAFLILVCWNSISQIP